MSTCRCGEPAVVQWKRRPSAGELEHLQAMAEGQLEAVDRVDEVPLPTVEDSFVAVYACADHAISADSAALVHQASCAGPGKGGACDCTPEQPIGDMFPDPESPSRLPPGW